MLLYLLKLSISLAVLYIFYRAVLRPLTFYQCNRFYLLGYSLLSFVIPFIDITAWLPGYDHEKLVNIIPAISYYNFAADDDDTRRSLLQMLSISDWMLVAFCTGALFMLIKLLRQYISLRNVRKHAVLLDGNENVQLFETSAVVSPFSFGNAIYFNRSMHTEEELQRIIQHEFVHVKQKHTIDLLIGEIMCIINWFNPFAWLMRHGIRQNLEFIADNNVVANGLDKKEYQYLLLKVVGVPQYSIANNFNFSNLKKRIAMMNKMKTSNLHLTKFLFVLPLMAVLFLAFRKSDTAKTVNPKTASLNKETADTIPGAPIKEMAVTPPVNNKGYITTILDNNGECIVLIKDKQQKIVKAITLAEWNKNKKENESRYGEIPPAPPPPPLPVIVAAPQVEELDLHPPDKKGTHTDNFENITIRSNTDLKKGIKTYTAVVTLKDGTVEKYNLNDPKQKAAYTEKYGAIPAKAPAPPVPPVDAPLPSSPDLSMSRGNLDLSNYQHTSNPPLYVVDGKPMLANYSLNNLNGDDIERIDVWKDKNATDKFGERAKNGVVSITMKKEDQRSKPAVSQPVLVWPSPTRNEVKADSLLGTLAIADSSGSTKVTIRKNGINYLPKDVLIIIDDKEMPAGSNIANLIKSENIESMMVTKGDAAVALYGNRAKGGVIVIKSKHAIPRTATSVKTDSTITGLLKKPEPVAFNFGQLTVAGSIVTNENESTIKGIFSFEYTTQVPLVIIDGAEMTGIASFKSKKGSYKMYTLGVKEAIAKYGDKAKYGALEINSL